MPPLRLFPGRQCRLAGLHQGRLRGHQPREPLAALGDRLQFPGLQGRRRRSRPSSTTTSGEPMQGFVLNMRRPQFQDRRVRQALTYAFDFESMNRTLFYGFYTRTDSYFEGGELASSGLPQGKELEILEPYRDKLPPEVFTEEFKLPVYDTPQATRDESARRRSSCSSEAGWDQQGRQAGQREDRRAVHASRFLGNDPTDERHHRPLHRQSAQARHRRDAAHRRTSQYVNRVRQFRLRHDHDGAGAVAVARQRAARLLVVDGRRHARLAQHVGHQGSGGRRAGRQGDLRHRPRGPGRRHPCARPGAAVELLRRAAVAPAGGLARLLEQVRHSGQAARLYRRRHRIPGGSTRPRKPRWPPSTRAGN